MPIWSAAFWRSTAERSAKTFAQTAISVLAVGHAAGLLDADWRGVASSAGLAAVISVLTSIASDVITGDGPSLADESIKPRRALPEE